MSDLPDPLVPPDCDLQAFPFMPLHVARLRDSDLAAVEDPEACWYAVLLWAASWHQIPAASVPDDDQVLARLCGLGRDVRTFKKHRQGALRGFIKCSDGRLYHPVVAEQALEAWEGREAFQERQSGAAERQARWRAEQRRLCDQLRDLGVTPPPRASKSVLQGLIDDALRRNGGGGPSDGDGVTSVTPSVTHAVTPENAVVTAKTGTGTGRETKAAAQLGERNAVTSTDPPIDKPRWTLQAIDEVTSLCWAAVGDQQRDRAASRPGLLVIGPILDLLDRGYDLHRHVLPVLRAKAGKLPKSWGSWAYFSSAVIDAAEVGSELPSPPAAASEQPNWDARERYLDGGKREPLSDWGDPRRWPEEVKARPGFAHLFKDRAA